MSRPKKKAKTVLQRLCKDDVMDIQSRFPKTSMADFIHVSVKWNPLVQAEAMLRGKPKNKNVKKKE